MRRSIASVLGLCLALALGAVPPVPAYVACVEISSGSDCFGECWIYDDETGRRTGHIMYRC